MAMENQTSGRPIESSQAGGAMLDEAKEQLRTFKQDTDQYIRKNPTKAVLTAFAIGFLVGVMRRR